MPKLNDITKKLIGDLPGRMELLLKEDSYSSFAEKTDLSKSQIQSIMRGRIPGIDKAAAIAKGAGVRLDWLILGEGPMMAPSADKSAKSLLSAENMKQVFADLETVGKMVEHFEENIRSEEKVFSPKEVSSIIRLLCIMAYGDVREFEADEIAEIVKSLKK